MILPEVRKSVPIQRRLWESTLRGPGASRYWVGEFCEELTARVSGAKRLKTDSKADVCPDHEFSSEIYFESKASGKTPQIILFSFRLNRYLQFIEQMDVKVYYWIWKHRSSTGGCETVESLQRTLAASLEYVLVVDHDTILQCTKECRFRTVNSGCRNGLGWTIGLKKLMTQSGDPQGFVPPDFSVYGIPIPEIPIFGTTPILDLLPLRGGGG